MSLFFFFFYFSELGNALEAGPIPATTTEAVEVVEDETGAPFKTGLLTATPVLGRALEEGVTEAFPVGPGRDTPPEEILSGVEDTDPAFFLSP